jgi:hypothetical protein
MIGALYLGQAYLDDSYPTSTTTGAITGTFTVTASATSAFVIGSILGTVTTNGAAAYYFPSRPGYVRGGFETASVAGGYQTATVRGSFSTGSVECGVEVLSGYALG